MHCGGFLCSYVYPVMKCNEITGFSHVCVFGLGGHYNIPVMRAVLQLMLKVEVVLV